MDVVTGEVTDLLQTLIRNRCVNEGTPESGHEVRNADVLESYLVAPGVEMQRFEPLPGRTSLVARIEGSDPAAPSLLLMGHTDVVPVSAERWQRDPFGGELVDGFVWGRGAVDMLNLTSSMAVAFRHLADEGFRPRGTLTYVAVADEENAGFHGAKWLTENARDAVASDFVLTEFGGFPMPSPSGPKLPIMVGEKGAYWCALRVRGTAGHGSMPFRADNALVKAAEVLRRLAAFVPQTVIHETWRRAVESMELPREVSAPLVDRERLAEFCRTLPETGLARWAFSCTHTTIAPTVMRAGGKINVIPDAAELTIDVRTLPGETKEDVRSMIEEALGDMAPEVEIEFLTDDEATFSPADSPLWDCLTRVSEKLRPGATTMPLMIVGATDARFFRRLGSVAYGYGLYSGRIGFSDFSAMFHGDDERVDVESLRLSTELWEAVARDFLS
jgi:acetylornithine deacetylase/succinyl-diaminopimelate desuccinylase-like protein